jgi:putative transposase
MIELSTDGLAVSRQCELLGVSRSGLYYAPKGLASEEHGLMVAIDKEYMAHPFYGSPRIHASLVRQGWVVNHKRVARLMRLMGIAAIYPKRNTSKSVSGNAVFPYLLRGLLIDRINQVWSTDITYIPMSHGFLYLTAVMDWYSRYVLSWSLSNTMTVSWCMTAVEAALRAGTPQIFNTDQGGQYTSPQFTGMLLERGIEVSMDGRGRALDNIFIERLWRSVKYEDVYLKEYADGHTLESGLGEYFRFYNTERVHQSLDYKTPAEVYFGQ